MTVKPDSRAEASAILRRNVGALSGAAMARMEAEKAWFRELSAQERSWIGLVVQAGISGFARWYAEHGTESTLSAEAESVLASDIFGQAPRAFAGVISLSQTVELSRITIDAVEEELPALLGKAIARDAHNAILRFGREYAFATAQVYASAAEARGAWDARLEALVVDSVLRDRPDESVLGQASALGWDERGQVVVVVGRAGDDQSQFALFDEVRRSAREAGMDALCGTRGDRTVVVLAGGSDPASAAAIVVPHFAPGPVVHGPATPDLGSAHLSSRAAMAAFRVVGAWPGAPRPVGSDELLPERAIDGDASARAQLVDEVYRPLQDAKGTLIETLDTYFGSSGSVEASARALFVHPNTVRYRLRQVAELTGLTASQARDAYALQVAITLGRLTER